MTGLNWPSLRFFSFTDRAERDEDVARAAEDQPAVAVQLVSDVIVVRKSGDRVVPDDGIVARHGFVVDQL